MKVYADFSNLCHCCGVTDIGEFSTQPSLYSWGGRKPLSPKVLKDGASGTGYYTATFIDSEACKHAFKWLTEHLDLLYQSPPLVNKKTGEQVFFCFFKEKSK